MALFVLLLVISDNTQCKVYSDCQSLINTFHKVKTNLEPAQKYRRPMYPIWNLITEWLHLRNITLVLIKVKRHSDNTFNQHADELARQGLVSSAFVISPEDIHFSDLALTSFRKSSTKTKSILEVDTRGFVHNLQQAILFEQLISLKRFTSLLPLHNSRDINVILFTARYVIIVTTNIFHTEP